MKRQLYILVSFLLLASVSQRCIYGQRNYATFSPVSIYPQPGIVNEIPNSIVIGFPSGIGKFCPDLMYLMDNEGNKVRNMTAQWLDESEYVESAPFYTQDKDLYEFVKFVFSGTKTSAVKTNGDYYFVIPEGFVWNDRYDPAEEDEGISDGARFNPDFAVEYHVDHVENVVNPSKSYTSEEMLQVITKSSNEAVSYSLDEFDKITFSKNGIQIWNTNWPTEYSYTNVRVLTFNGAFNDNSADAVQEVTERSEGEQIFDLQGRKLNRLKRGVNIIKMKDGSTRKVLLK